MDEEDMANTPKVMYTTARGSQCIDSMDIGYVYNASKYIVRQHGRVDLQDVIQAAEEGTARLILKWLVLHHKEEYENSREYHVKLWNSLPEKFQYDGSHPHPDDSDGYDYFEDGEYEVNEDRVTVEKLLQQCSDFVNLYRYPETSVE
jgi:hypothetical protein